METVRESDEEMDSENELLPYTYEGGRNENGERHGKGKARLPNGDLYEGEYKNGYRNGYGKYVFRKLKGKSRNACYMGHYENNKKNGQGTFLYPDGAKYEGCWKEDLRHGFGSYYYTNGDLYRGEWEHDRRHGQGSYTYAASGMSYEGQWFEGKRSGKLNTIIHVIFSSLPKRTTIKIFMTKRIEFEKSEANTESVVPQTGLFLLGTIILTSEAQICPISPVV